MNILVVYRGHYLCHLQFSLTAYNNTVLMLFLCTFRYNITGVKHSLDSS